MVTLLEWFGEEPIYYYLIAFGALAAFLILAARPGPRLRERRSEIIFLLITGLALFAFRWPVFIVPFQLGPDEAAFVANALKVTADLAPWRNFDAGTSGPLNCYVLALPALIGLQINFTSARIIGLFLMLTAMLALYYAGKWTYGRDVARLSIVPPVLLLALTTDFSFVQYTSEHLSICLTTVALGASAYLASARGSTRARLTAAILAGFCIGATPFAKLQAGPIALAVFVVAIAGLLSSGRGLSDSKFLTTAYVSALCLMPGVIALSVWYTKMWNDAWTSYIRAAFDYIAGGYIPGGKERIDPAFFFRSTDIYPAFLKGAIAIILLGALSLIWRRNLSRLTRWSLAASILLLLATFYSIYQAHRYYEHYLLFSLVPIACCVSGALGLIRQGAVWEKRKALKAICYVALFAIPMIAVFFSSRNEFVRTIRNHTRVLRSAGGLAIEQYAKPGDVISIWGCAPRFYVETQTIMATRDSETSRLVFPNRYRDYFRSRFLRDLEAWKPVVFVDAVGPNALTLVDRASQGHESFPALAAYVQEHYELKEEVAGIRIYQVRGR
jgi:hypothetical protein